MHHFHNSVQLIGRSGRRVVLSHQTDGTPRATATLYLQQPVGSGLRAQQRFSLVCWGRMATEFFERVGKGDRLLVQGRLVNRERSRDAVTYLHTEVHLQFFSVLSDRRRPSVGFDDSVAPTSEVATHE